MLARIIGPATGAAVFLFSAFALQAEDRGAPSGAETARPPGVVTFTFDDGLRSQYDLALPLLVDYGVPGTLFVVSDFADTADAASGLKTGKAQVFMTWDEIRAYQAAGWEIGSHSATHPHLSEHAPDRITAEIETAAQRIAEETGRRPAAFAPPYGDFDARSLEIAMRRHSSHVLAWDETGTGNRIASLDPARIVRLEVGSDMAPEIACAEVLRAAREGRWLVLMFHGFVEEDPGSYEYATGDFAEILACADYLRDAGLVRFATVTDVVEEAAATN